MGAKDGHYFWVTPDRSHIVDLTGDKQHGSSEIPTKPIHHTQSAHEWAAGPIHLERADHPHWKGFRVVEAQADNPRVALFCSRANASLNGDNTDDALAPLAKTADLMGPTDYTGETPEKVEQMNQLNFHDEPGYKPDSQPQTFKFVFANGQIHVSPVHDHAELLGHAGQNPDEEGPVAVGDVTVRDGKALWRVETNVGQQGLRDALVAYSHQVGWQFEGQVGTDGQPMGLDLGPVTSYWYRVANKQIEISRTPPKHGHRIYMSGSTAWVDKIHPGLQDWAQDFNLKLAEYLESTMNWQPGNMGKGLISNGQLHTWNTSTSRNLFHQDYLDSIYPEIQSQPRDPLSGLPPYRNYYDTPVVIDPSGYYTSAENPLRGKPGKDVTRFAQAHPALKYLPVDRWTQKVYGSERFAEYPGGTTMQDRMKTRENLDLYNNADPSFQPERDNPDLKPEGPFTCKHDDQVFPTFDAYRMHMRDHEPADKTEVEDGHFPQMQDFDIPMGFGTQPVPSSAWDGVTIAKISAFITPWQRGSYGKGLMTGTGSPISWRVGPGEKANGAYAFQRNPFGYGYPHHHEVVKRLGVTGTASRGYFYIHPEGGVEYVPGYDHAVDDEATLASFIGSNPSFYEHPDPPQEPFQVGEPAGTEPIPDGNNTIAMVLASDYEAHRIPEFATYSKLFGFDDKCRYYGAYRNGEMLGYGVVREHWGEPEVLMIQSATHHQGVGTAILEHIKRHYSVFFSHADSPGGEALMRRCGMVNVKGQMWRYAGNEPKDMIEQDIPFVFDIPEDRLEIGYPGSSTHDVRLPGKFTPGGLVEGYYAPGGKLTVQTASSWPISLRHLMDLWYHQYPQMEITSLEETEQDGSTTKLASGTQKLFEYHCLEDPSSSDAEAWYRSHQSVSIMHQLTDVDEEDAGGPMYHVRFPDGHEHDVFHHELVDRPSQYIRPDPPTSEEATQMANQPDWVPHQGAVQEEDPAYVGNYLHTLVNADLPAQKAYNALKEAGGKVSVVGGAVRDALLGKVPNDLDLMVSGLRPEDVDHTLSQLPGRMDYTGKRFGVYRYRIGGSDVEVALPRTDTYESGRRGEGQIKVDPDLPIEKDLERRDFTANSMAVDLDSRKLIDPYGGAKDIERGVLRTTHPDSFKEDPTRLVRALTAHGRFGLMPDERTRHEMEANAHLLRGESPDALNQTIDKLMKSPNPASAVRLGHETGVLQHLFPEVSNNWDYDQNNPHHNYPLGEHLMHALDNVSRLTTDPDVRMAAMMHDVGKPASEWTDSNTGYKHFYTNTETGEGAMHEDVGAQLAHDRMRQLNYSGPRIKRVQNLIANHMFPPFSTPKGARKFLHRVGDDHADDLLNLREADQTGKGQTPEEVNARTSADTMRGLVEQSRSAQEPTQQSALSVDGNDLIGMGLPAGPQIGQVLRYLTDEVVADPMLNQRDQLLQLASEYVQAQPQ